MSMSCALVLGLVLALAPIGPAFALDANTASAGQLQTIRGIGPSTAARIIEARTRRPFRDLDDLRERVRGIGEKNLAKMRDGGLDVGGGARLAQSGSPVSMSAPGTAAPRAVEIHIGRPR